jgi:hypothetical protein
MTVFHNAYRYAGDYLAVGAQAGLRIDLTDASQHFYLGTETHPVAEALLASLHSCNTRRLQNSKDSTQTDKQWCIYLELALLTREQMG